MATNEGLDLEALEEEITDADAMVDSLCNGAKWTMCVPARPGQDSDLVIADGLAAGRKAIRELRAARQRIAALEGERDALQRTVDGWAGIVAAHQPSAALPSATLTTTADYGEHGQTLHVCPATPAAREGEG